MIYHLSPSIQRKIWGGKNLETLKNLPQQSGVDPVGETWEISIHPDGPSFYQGKKLELKDESEELSYLVKLIDTGDELSIQVHPGDEYARLHENSSGKSECWLILQAAEGAGIYLGLKSGVTKETFQNAIKNKMNMNELLNFYQVKTGDFFFVPAGSIHAIGAGITLAEVQQNSGITYRVWDWNRVDSKGNPRELHIDKSLDVINFDPQANTPVYFKIHHDLFQTPGKRELVTHPSFKFSLVNLDKNQSIILDIKKEKRLSSLLNLYGGISINGERLGSYSAALFRDEEKITVVANENTSFLWLE